MLPGNIKDNKAGSYLGAYYPSVLWAIDPDMSYFLALATKKEVSDTSLVLFTVTRSNFFYLVVPGLDEDTI